MHIYRVFVSDERHTRPHHLPSTIMPRKSSGQSTHLSLNSCRLSVAAKLHSSRVRPHHHLCVCFATKQMCYHPFTFLFPDVHVKDIQATMISSSSCHDTIGFRRSTFNICDGAAHNTIHSHNPSTIHLHLIRNLFHSSPTSSKESIIMIHRHHHLPLSPYLSTI